MAMKLTTACVILHVLHVTTTAHPVVGETDAGTVAGTEASRPSRTGNGHRERCGPPAHLHAMFRQINSQTKLTQFLQKAVSEQATRQAAGAEPDLSDLLSVRPICPRQLRHSHSAPVASQSLCPYFFGHLRLPSGYYPPVVPTARCNCTYCVGHHSLACKPVVSTVVVLRPVGCFQGLQRFQEAYQEVTTGCTCVV